MGVLNTGLVYEVLSVVKRSRKGVWRPRPERHADRQERETGRRNPGHVIGQYPCHRVVNHAGRTAPGFCEHKDGLETEDVGFRENGCMDLAKTCGRCLYEQGDR